MASNVAVLPNHQSLSQLTCWVVSVDVWRWSISWLQYAYKHKCIYICNIWVATVTSYYCITPHKAQIRHDTQLTAAKPTMTKICQHVEREKAKTTANNQLHSSHACKTRMHACMHACVRLRLGEINICLCTHILVENKWVRRKGKRRNKWSKQLYI